LSRKTRGVAISRGAYAYQIARWPSWHDNEF
jgi:hypothetical protein